MPNLNIDEVKSLEGAFEECFDLEELNFENINNGKIENLITYFIFNIFYLSVILLPHKFWFFQSKYIFDLRL